MADYCEECGNKIKFRETRHIVEFEDKKVLLCPKCKDKIEKEIMGEPLGIEIIRKVIGYNKNDNKYGLITYLKQEDRNILYCSLTSGLILNKKQLNDEAEKRCKDIRASSYIKNQLKEVGFSNELIQLYLADIIKAIKALYFPIVLINFQDLYRAYTVESSGLTNFDIFEEMKSVKKQKSYNELFEILKEYNKKETPTDVFNRFERLLNIFPTIEEFDKKFRLISEINNENTQWDPNLDGGVLKNASDAGFNIKGSTIGDITTEYYSQKIKNDNGESYQVGILVHQADPIGTTRNFFFTTIFET